MEQLKNMKNASKDSIDYSFFLILRAQSVNTLNINQHDHTFGKLNPYVFWIK